MKLQDILKEKGSKVWTILQDQSVYEALQVLSLRKIGALVVLNEEDLVVGIISERDIVRGCLQYPKDVSELPLSDFMTRKVIAADPEDDVESLMRLMTENRIRHVPVMKDGALMGMISIGDLLKSQLRDSAHQIRFLKEYVYGAGEQAAG